MTKSATLVDEERMRDPSSLLLYDRVHAFDILPDPLQAVVPVETGLRQASSVHLPRAVPSLAMSAAVARRAHFVGAPSHRDCR
jgi:hypothetical protein